MAKRQIVYLFDEADKESLSTLGGKGLGLVEMTKDELPVPPGFVVRVGVSRAYFQQNQLPKRIDWQLKRAINLLQKKTGRTFGDPENPLLVSLRSGAKESMPGMMDTILNLGINKTIVRGLIKATRDKEFAWETYQRFLLSYGSTVMGVPEERFEEVLKSVSFSDSEGQPRPVNHELVCRLYLELIENVAGQPVPDDPRIQLVEALQAVFGSWHSPRASEYRRINIIPDHLGTAVVVQAMVFGNLDENSGTGVVFSRNVSTGEPTVYGEYLPKAQGEDVVSGQLTPYPIIYLKERNNELYQQLITYVSLLERKYRDVVEVEFTIEQGKLFLLQVRVAKRSPKAAIKIAVNMVSEGFWTKDEAMIKVSDDVLESAQRHEFDPKAYQEALNDGKLLVDGLSASDGAAVGVVAFDSATAQLLAQDGKNVILVRRDTSPDDLPGMLVAKAIVTSTGGVTSHAAVVARSLGIPAVVGASRLSISLSRQEAYTGERSFGSEALISIDGTTGRVFIGEIPLQEAMPDEAMGTFMSWLSSEMPGRRYDVKLAEEYFSVNEFLNDFYISSALAKAYPNSNLSRQARTVFWATTQKIAPVYATYLCLAVGGEIRHAWGSIMQMGEITDQLEKLEELGFKVHSREEAQQVVLSLMAVGRKEPVIRFLELASQAFQLGVWSSSMGGKRWHQIAYTTKLYLEDRIKADLFVDQVFDLRHNGGRLFDKHQMVEFDSSEPVLRQQLDAKKKHQGDALTLAQALTRYDGRVSPPVRSLLEMAKRRKR